MKRDRITLIDLGGALYLSAADAQKFLDGLSGDVNEDDVDFAGRFHTKTSDSFFSEGKLTPSGEKILEGIAVLALKASRADAAGNSRLFCDIIEEIISQTELLKLVK